MRNTTRTRFGVRALAATVAGLMLGGVIGALPATADDNVNDAGYHAISPAGLSRPATVPSLDGWSEGTGSWTLGEGSRVVADESLAARADMLSTELTAFSGLDVPAATGASSDKDVTLVQDASQSTTLGSEGFTLSIDEHGLTVTGATDIGVFYGTRSVSQMLRQGQLTLPAGTVTSTPAYAERGATLCACQINISTDWIDRFLSDMADLKLNYLLMEMKLKPDEDNTKKAATWSYYTSDDVKAFVTKAKAYGIDVIPEINSPGHMNIWLENYPEYQLVDRNGNRDSNRLDITNPEAVQFYKTLIDEYDGAFDTEYWHMGADEYMIGSSFSNYPQLQEFAEEHYGAGATPNDAFTAFINEINDYVKDKGKQLRIWNDGIVDTTHVILDKDIIIEYWDGQGRRPSALASEGYQLMNATGSLYWSRSNTGFKVNTKNLYNNKSWNAGTFVNEQIDKDYEGLLGAKVSIWPDDSFYQTENEVEQEIFDSMRFVAQMTWSDSRPWASWEGEDGMKAAIDSIGYPLAIRQYDYHPVEEGTYDIPELDAFAEGPWNLKKTYDGYYQFEQASSGQCLALYDGVGSSNLVKKHLGVVTQVGARPELRKCADVSVSWDQRNTSNERNTQKWQIRADKDGKYTIAPALTQQRLAVATGTEQHIDLEQMQAEDASLVPAAGTIAQFPADLVGDNALFTLNGRLGMTASAESTTVNPGAPTDITVRVTASSAEATGAVTVTANVPEGWSVLPATVDLKSIPAGKTARAIFRVVNTTGEGAADITFTLTDADGNELATSTAPLTGTLTADVTTGDYATDSQETAQEDGAVDNAFDKDTTSYWHSRWSSGEDLPPHWIAFKANTDGEQVKTVTQLPRQGTRMNGLIQNYELYVVSADVADSTAAVTDAQWGDPVAAGEFPYNNDLQTIELPDSVPTGDVYIKLVALQMYPIPEDYPDGPNANFTSIAELNATTNVAAVELTEPTQPSDNPVAEEVDKSKLEAEVAKADGLDGTKYTPNSWASYQTALNAAKDVLADDDATQTAVNDALAALQNAATTLAKKADTTALADEVAKADGLDGTKYTAESWEAYQAALTTARDVLGNANATQTQVDDALKALQAAAPTFKPDTTEVNKELLQAEVDKADGLDETKYTAESWKAYQAALTTARDVLGNANATQTQVDDALKALQAAAPVLKPDTTEVNKELLQAEVAKADGLDETKYTAESWKAYQAALTAARGVLANADATQGEVDAALAALQAAAPTLKPSTTDPDPDPQVKPTPDPDKKPAISDTGSSVLAVVAVAAALAVAGGAGLVWRRRRS